MTEYLLDMDGELYVNSDLGELAEMVEEFLEEGGHIEDCTISEVKPVNHAFNVQSEITVHGIDEGFENKPPEYVIYDENGNELDSVEGDEKDLEYAINLLFEMDSDVIFDNISIEKLTFTNCKIDGSQSFDVEIFVEEGSNDLSERPLSELFELEKQIQDEIRRRASGETS